MGLIIYDERTILEAKNHIDTCNEEILTAIEKIYNEFENMSVTLNTPRSSKRIPTFIDYFKNRVTYMKNSKDNYNRMLDTINGEYHSYTNKIKEMVGGKNGE